MNRHQGRDESRPYSMKCCNFLINTL